MTVGTTISRPLYARCAHPLAGALPLADALAHPTAAGIFGRPVPGRTLESAQLRAGRTTRLTPSAVKAVPAIVAAVMVSPNNNQAIMAVVGGTKYIRLVTDAAAPRWIKM